ncbi:MAG: hypothetical protein RMY33_034460 [Nostoc sp. DedQUE03]
MQYHTAIASGGRVSHRISRITRAATGANSLISSHQTTASFGEIFSRKCANTTANRESYAYPYL